jgi:hypothetical protein
MLRAAGPQQWVWEECRDLNAMQFRFKDKERPQGYVCSLAGHLHDYSIEVRFRYNVSSFYAFLVPTLYEIERRNRYRIPTFIFLFLYPKNF